MSVTYVTVGVWLDGVHRGKSRKVGGHTPYDTEDEALRMGATYNPIGHIYRHGSTGNRWRVTGHETKKLK